MLHLFFYKIKFELLLSPTAGHRIMENSGKCNEQAGASILPTNLVFVTIIFFLGLCRPLSWQKQDLHLFQSNVKYLSLQCHGGFSFLVKYTDKIKNKQ